MALDCRDKLVIDLADWGRTAYLKGGGGVLRCIHGSYLALLSSRRPWGRDADRAHRANGYDEQHAAARARLFPQASERTSQEDFEALMTAVAKRFEPVLLDRHQNRAHEYEQSRRETAAVRMLDFADLRSAIEHAHAVLYDLSIVAIGTSFELNVRFASKATEVGAELVEMILIPTATRRKLVEAGVSVESFLAELHDRDESPPTAPDEDPDDDGPILPAFNDLNATRIALERLGLARTFGGA